MSAQAFAQRVLLWCQSLNGSSKSGIDLQIPEKGIRSLKSHATKQLRVDCNEVFALDTASPRTWLTTLLDSTNR